MSRLMGFSVRRSEATQQEQGLVVVLLLIAAVLFHRLAHGGRTLRQRERGVGSTEDFAEARFRPNSVVPSGAKASL